eukprot:GHVT01010751.1.p1 GENE.GHVT01010751.1~~GHVT01010751.1.p1  ORF type:complete len:237 (+),score=37.71 GHVT01010751.1:1965-2675(+)
MIAFARNADGAPHLVIPPPHPLPPAAAAAAGVEASLAIPRVCVGCRWVRRGLPPAAGRAARRSVLAWKWNLVCLGAWAGGEGTQSARMTRAAPRRPRPRVAAGHVILQSSTRGTKSPGEGLKRQPEANARLALFRAVRLGPRSLGSSGRTWIVCGGGNDRRRRVQGKAPAVGAWRGSTARNAGRDRRESPKDKRRARAGGRKGNWGSRNGESGAKPPRGRRREDAGRAGGGTSCVY